MKKSILSYSHYISDRKIVKARLLFVRTLVVEYEVPYRIAWRFAGFASRREMERCWEQMF